MRAIAAAFTSGLVFAIGLGISGMTRPTKVVAFLDFTGDWDPSLAFVMAGAIAVHAGTRRWILGRSGPLFGVRFEMPTRAEIDEPLLVGAALFGLGWGLAGFCPGPALVSFGGGGGSALLFVPAMIVGMLAHDLFAQPTANPAAGDPTPPH